MHSTLGFINAADIYAKGSFTLAESDFLKLCRFSMLIYNWILYEPIWKRRRFRFHFRFNINELLRFIYIERKRISLIFVATQCEHWILYEPI